MQLTLGAARRRRKVSLSNLSAKTGLSKSTISRIERGLTKPLHDSVSKIEDALGYPHGTLKFTAREAVAS